MISLLVNSHTPKEDTLNCCCCRVSIGSLLIAFAVIEMAAVIFCGLIYWKYFPSLTQDHLIIFCSTASAFIICDLAFAIFAYCKFGTPEKIDEQNYIENLLREQRRQWERKPDVLGGYMKREN